MKKRLESTALQHCDGADETVKIDVDALLERASKPSERYRSAEIPPWKGNIWIFYGFGAYTRILR